MKKTYTFLGTTLSLFLLSNAHSTTAQKWGGIYDGPQEKVVHHATGAKVDHKLEAKREKIRKEINDAHKTLSQFSKIYNAMHGMRLEVESMHTKMRGKVTDQKRLMVLEKEWNKAQSELRMALIKKKVPPFAHLHPDTGIEREIWDNFPNQEASELEATLREIRRWQSYENIDLQTGAVKSAGGSLYDEEKPTGKSMDFKSVRLSDLSDDEDF